jgi:recombination protein RecA
MGKEKMERKRREQPNSKKTRVEFLGTGSHLLNLAASGKADGGGWARGRVINIVGDNSTGKTLLALEACAQAYFNLKNIKSELFPEVKSFSIVYNNVEGVMDFNLEQLFGKEFESNIKWEHSETAEEWGRDYARRIEGLKKGESLLYVLDSLDALDSEAAKERFEEAMKKDKQEKGSYKVEKAKYLSSSFFNQLCRIMKGKDATLIIVSQIRDKIGAMFGETKYRAGGKAMDFYCHQVCWLAVIGKVKKKDRITAINIKAKFKKNKCYKPFRECNFPIIFDYGVDDIGSMVEYLKLDKGCIEEVEEGGAIALKELINDTQIQWDEEEEAAATKRRAKYER